MSTRPRVTRKRLPIFRRGDNGPTTAHTGLSSLCTTQPHRLGVLSGIQQFEDAQRIAKALASSTFSDPASVPRPAGFRQLNLVALEIAGRMGISPFLAMQHLHVIHGRPSWSSSFIIAMVNGCGRFSPLRFELSGSGDSLACYAVAKDLASGQELKGPTITMAMAKKEGWATKSGSKWQTMPELMIRYRAAAFWGRLYASDMLLGMQSQEEVVDVEPVTVTETSVADLNAAIAQPAPEAPVAAPVEADQDELF
jgi:hypothetical protein